MSELTVYSAASSDGSIWHTASTWATVRNASVGTTLNDAVTNKIFAQSTYYSPPTGWYLTRGFFVFDTSSLPDNAIITAADLSLYTYERNEIEGASAHIVQSTQASPTALVLDDYDQVGATSGGSKTLASFVNMQRNSIDLNATGLSWISKTGYTKLAIRTSLDLNNIAPGNVNNLSCFFADQAGQETYHPRLVITYSLPTIYGLKVSKSGYDVKACADENLAFSSEFSYPHADITGTVEITINDGQNSSAWTVIPHNYGYKPMFMCWLEMTQNIELPWWRGTSWSDYWGGSCKINRENLFIQLRRNTTSGTATKTVYYLIFKENLTYEGALGGEELMDYASAVGSTDISTTSTSFVDMTGMSVTLTTGSGLTLIMFTACMQASTQIGIQVLEDSAVIHGGTHGDRIFAVTGGVYADMSAGVAIIVPRVTTAASHTYKVQWKAVLGGTVYQYGTTSAPRRLTVISYS